MDAGAGRTKQGVKGRAAYQEFLAQSKDADPNVPVLRQARSELSRLPDQEQFKIRAISRYSFQ
jgi:hypothetical protein